MTSDLRRTVSAGSSAAEIGRAFWGDVAEEILVDLPPVCCGRCEHFVPVLRLSGRCDWPKPESWPDSFAAIIMPVNNGTKCTCFKLLVAAATRDKHPAPDITPVPPIPPDDLDFDGIDSLPLFAAGGSRR